MSRRLHGLMMERCLFPSKVRFLVDLGSVDDKASRDFADRMRAAGIPGRRFSIEGNRRLLVALPNSKAEAIIRQFEIGRGAGYWQCTHHRPGVDGPAAGVPHG